MMMTSHLTDDHRYDGSNKLDEVRRLWPGGLRADIIPQAVPHFHPIALTSMIGPCRLHQ